MRRGARLRQELQLAWGAGTEPLYQCPMCGRLHLFTARRRRPYTFEPSPDVPRDLLAQHPAVVRDPGGQFPLSPPRVDALLTGFVGQGRAWGGELLLPQDAVRALLQAAEVRGLAVLGVTFYGWAQGGPVPVDGVTLMDADHHADQRPMTTREALNLWPVDATHAALLLDEA